jgi:basic membrane protein A
MRARVGSISLLLAVTLAAAACGSSKKSSSTTLGAGATTAPAGGATTTGGSSGGCKAGTVPPAALPDKGTVKADPTKTVGLLFDVTGRGDKSFNDSAAAGLDKAKTDFGIKSEESTPTAADGSDRPDRLKTVVDNGNGLIIGVGFLWESALKAAATANSTKSFAIVDDVVDLPNTSSLLFAANQGSFLVGAAAACESKSGKIGFIGGVQNDLIKAFEVGFVAGVKQVKPTATVDIKYLSQPPDTKGFNDPAGGKSTAAAMYSSGIDVIYHAAGGSGPGVFQAAKDTGKKPGDVWAIGVDSDQYLTASADLQPYILTSALKRVDTAVYETIKAYVGGTFKPGVQNFDLKSGGVGYAGSNPEINKIAGTLEDLKQQIIDGKITVPSK